MASKYLLDTNIVIYALGSVKSAVEYINKVTLDGGELCFSTITEAEIFSKPLEEKVRDAFKDFFSTGTIIPVTSARPQCGPGFLFIIAIAVYIHWFDSQPVILTRHLPQVPFPAQGPSISRRLRWLHP